MLADRVTENLKDLTSQVGIAKLLSSIFFLNLVSVDLSELLVTLV